MSSSRKNKKLLVALVLDASGSMQPQTRAVVESVNGFVDARREEGECSIRLTIFSEPTRIRHRRACKAKDFPRLGPPGGVGFDPKGHFLYSPQGSTALLDAINETLDAIEIEEKGKDVGRVLVAIITDGEENASRVHTLAATRQRIEHLRELGRMEFVFLGADIDVFTEASKLGIPGMHTCMYVGTPKGYGTALRRLDTVTRSFAVSGEIHGMGTTLPETERQP